MLHDRHCRGPMLVLQKEGITKVLWLCCRRESCWSLSCTACVQRVGGIAKVPWLCCMKDKAILEVNDAAAIAGRQWQGPMELLPKGEARVKGCCCCRRDEAWMRSHGSA